MITYSKNHGLEVTTLSTGSSIDSFFKCEEDKGFWPLTRGEVIVLCVTRRI